MTTDPVTRVGWGFDVHPLDGDPPLKLGGVVVSDSLGVSATSDGDVLAHAVSDAVAGAAAIGDVGEHFPPEEPASRDADSMVMLGQVVSSAAVAGCTPAHVDVTIVTEAVRISPHRESIRAALADVLGLGVDSVSVKATTTDGLGFIGRGEGLAAMAVVTMTHLHTGKQ